MISPLLEVNIIKKDRSTQYVNAELDIKLEWYVSVHYTDAEAKLEFSFNKIFGSTTKELNFVDYQELRSTKYDISENWTFSVDKEYNTFNPLALFSPVSAIINFDKRTVKIQF